MAERARVAAALIAVQLFFGLHYLAAKVVLAFIPPAGWAMLRAALGAALLAAIVLLTGRRLPGQPGLVWRLALYALFGIVINQLCFAEGLARTSPAHAAIINTTIPVWTLLCAVLAGRERIRPRRLVALAAAAIGVWLVIRPDAAALAVGASRLGDLLILTNAVSYSIFLVLSKPLLARIDALAATTLLLAWGSAGLAVFGLPALAGFDPLSVPASVWGLMAFIVVFPTAGAYLLTYWALARVDSSVVALFIYLQPVVAGTLSFLLLDEAATGSLLVGATLIFVAVWLASEPRRRRARREDPAAGAVD